MWIWGRGGALLGPVDQCSPLSVSLIHLPALSALELVPSFPASDLHFVCQPGSCLTLTNPRWGRSPVLVQHLGSGPCFQAPPPHSPSPSLSVPFPSSISSAPVRCWEALGSIHCSPGQELVPRG